MIRGVPILDSTGRAKEWTGSTLDITDLKNAELAFKASESDFRLLAEAMPQIVWATRADGWNTYFNKQWVDYTGMSLEATGTAGISPFTRMIANEPGTRGRAQYREILNTRSNAD